MHIKPLLIDEALQICQWTYPDEYSFYDVEDSPDARNELMDGTYYAVKAKQNPNELIGFFCYGSNAQVGGGRQLGLYQGDDVLDIGLGMNPNLIGRGSGMLFLSAGIQFAEAAFNPQTLRLSVAKFNQRAIRLYTNAGFVTTTSFDNNGTAFLIMKRKMIR